MSKPTHEKLLLGDIEVPAGRRSLNEATVRDIADSMRAVGQLQPITVIDTGDGYRLISGAHRVAAARLIADAIPFEEWEDHPGIGSINAIVLPQNWDGNPRLIEISENLHRAELTSLTAAPTSGIRAGGICFPCVGDCGSIQPFYDGPVRALWREQGVGRAPRPASHTRSLSGREHPTAVFDRRRCCSPARDILKPTVEAAPERSMVST